MLVKFKDTDFLHASSRIKSLEKKLITKRQLGQMADANTIDEAYKIVLDAGIGAGLPPEEYEQALRRSLLETYELLGTVTGVPEVFHIFRYEYDGLNLKILVKSEALGLDPIPRMTALGTISPAALQEQFKVKKLEGVPGEMAAGTLEASETLARTGDPQAVDILIDKAVLAAMDSAAKGYDNRFLHRLVECKIDISNIRCMVRIKRMDKDTDFFRRVLAPGGAIDADAMADAYAKGMDQVVALIESSAYGPTLEPALSELRKGGSLSLFEKLCDNYLIGLTDGARLVPFGIEPMISYLYAKESEIKAARIVLASRMAGVAPELIKERLRETYA